MYTTNFINQNGEKNIVDAGRKHLESTLDTLSFFLDLDSKNIQEILDDCEDKEICEQIAEELKEQDWKAEETDLNDLSSSLADDVREYYQTGFSEYGLSFGYSGLEEGAKGSQDYFRYLMSWGGPSDEVRFYKNGAIEYVFLDWFCGVGFNVTNDPIFKALREWFNDCGIMDFVAEREKYDYYTILAENEAE